jgi:hypothetical protein
MEIEPEKFRLILRRMLEQMKTLETEILCLKALYAGSQGWTTNELIAENFKGVEAALELVRNNENIKANIDQKFSPAFEFIDKAVDAKKMEDAMNEFLKNWKPTGQAN